MVTYPLWLKKDPNWFRLDNAGKLYPAMLGPRYTSFFRFTAELDEPVHAGHLQAALDKTIHRFPYFLVHLKRGYFWFFFESGQYPPKVERDSLFPCMNYPLRREHQYPFRVRAHGKRLSLEFSHVITDGTGAVVFFKTLLAAYFCCKDPSFDWPRDILHYGDEPDPAEFEDSFRRYYRPDLPLPKRGEMAFHLPDPLLPHGQYRIVTGELPLDQLKTLSREAGVSITEFLIACQMEALQDAQKIRLGPDPALWFPIRLSVPVNLRNFYESQTMRNFFLSVEPSIDPRLGLYSFNEITERVHHYMRMAVNRKDLDQQITRNIRGEIHTAARLMPLTWKNLVIPILYRKIAEATYSSGLSNLGVFSLPDNMAGKVKKFLFIPPPAAGIRTKSAIVSYNGTVSISFGRLTEDPIIERLFFRSLRKKGLPVRIESNDPVIHGKG